MRFNSIINKPTSALHASLTALVSICCISLATASPKPSPNRLTAKVIKQLQHEQFEVRQTALSNLQKWHSEAKSNKMAAMFTLRELKHTKSPEVKVALFSLLLENRDLINTFSASHFKDKQGYLGVSHNALTLRLKNKSVAATRITVVVDGTPAQRAGFKVNDIILKVGGKAVPSLRYAGDNVLSTLIRSYKPCQQVTFTILRNQKPMEIKAILASTELIDNPQPIDKNNFTKKDRRAFVKWLKTKLFSNTN